MNSDSLPLAGINIVEIGIMIAVPGATRILADYGANVVKVEDTALGDGSRFFGSQKGGISAIFFALNRGKRSIAVDLKKEEGKEILWKLLDIADVVVNGYRPGVLEKLGFSYETVKQRNENIIFCSSSGFGAEGPYGNQPAYDPVIQALSGWAGIQLENDEPRLVKGLVADKVSALTNAHALLAAIIQKERTGVGAKVELSMLDANLAFNWPDVMMDIALKDEDALGLPNVLEDYRLYRCLDGWVSLAPGTDDHWRSICNALERPELLDDDRLMTAASRSAQINLFQDTLQSMVESLSVDDVVSRLRDAEVPVAPVLERQAVSDDPQVAAAGCLEKFKTKHVGTIEQPRSARTYLGFQEQDGHAPRQGEHTSELLHDLGFSDDQKSSFFDRGVVLERKEHG